MGDEADKMRKLFDGVDAHVRSQLDEMFEGDLPPLVEDHLDLAAVGNLCLMHDKAIPMVAPDEETAVELRDAIAATRDAMPSRLTAQVYGPVAADPAAVMGDLIEVAAKHREIIHLVARELLAEPEDATGGFADAPLPDRSDADLADALRAAVDSHSDAIVELAKAREDM